MRVKALNRSLILAGFIYGRRWCCMGEFMYLVLSTGFVEIEKFSTHCNGPHLTVCVFISHQLSVTWGKTRLIQIFILSLNQIICVWLFIGTNIINIEHDNIAFGLLIWITSKDRYLIAMLLPDRMRSSHDTRNFVSVLIIWWIYEIMFNDHGKIFNIYLM